MAKVTILCAKSETSLTRVIGMLPRLHRLAMPRTIGALIRLILHYELPSVLPPEALEALFILLQLMDGGEQCPVVLALGYQQEGACRSRFLIMIGGCSRFLAIRCGREAFLLTKGSWSLKSPYSLLGILNGLEWSLFDRSWACKATFGLFLS
jgi:hypothetical protein